MHINKSYLVLEVGPGGYPHWRSDCLLDKWDQSSESDVNTSQFGGTAQVTKGKPLFITKDGIFPFKDKRFDYVICSQVLEHVPVCDLPLFISEINRVSSRCYIEIPTFLYDYMYDFEVHVNLMDIVNGEIICLDKSTTSLHSVNRFTQHLLQKRIEGVFPVEMVNKSLFITGKEFSGNIPLRIVESEEKFFEIIRGKRENTPSPSFFWLARNKINQTLRKYKKEKPVSFFG
ncbi:MAG: class I SAM-dependent methyltransferase [Bacteroidetes bacterium]|nr:class I SAM-dependent methyltransferase [Bacteroidota bacterium]